jgi:hypothetical protein
MSDDTRPRHPIETFGLTCWRCHCGIEIATNAQPYTCSLCGALLLIQWGERSSLCAPPAASDSLPGPRSGAATERNTRWITHPLHPQT